jgi:glycosyltransferase involved in cell wall biosynthesis
VYNDWECAEEYVRAVAGVADIPRDLTLILVDDGSTHGAPPFNSWTLRAGMHVRIVSLGTNLGHQRAIAAGLVEASKLPEISAVVVSDADGEDRPADLAVLWSQHIANPDVLVVAQRRKRTENVKFKTFYRGYRWVFFLLTGQHLDFGNFSLIPGRHLPRICMSPLLWRHYPATLMRSRLQMMRVPLDRGKRYSGQSRMNFISLVNHGLSGMSSFSDVVYARLLAAAGVSVVMMFAVVLSGIAVRVSTGSALPGWMALAAAIAALALAQIIATVLVVSFLTFAVGALSGSPPATIVPQFVRSIWDDRWDGESHDTASPTQL